jgi:hypothetical protein
MKTEELAMTPGSVTTVCPCGASITIGFAHALGDDELTPTALHPLPPCAAYVELELTDYVTYVRCALAASTAALAGGIKQ